MQLPGDGDLGTGDVVSNRPVAVDPGRVDVVGAAAVGEPSGFGVEVHERRSAVPGLGERMELDHPFSSLDELGRYLDDGSDRVAPVGQTVLCR